MGLAAKDLRTGETILVNADTRFPTASAIKTAVMVEVYHQIAEGRFRRDTPLTLTDADKVGEPVLLNHLHAGLTLTVSDLLALMITVSDNTATNMLVGLVGTASVDRRLASYGLSATRLFRPTFRDGHADVFPDEEREFGLGAATPREMAHLMELIAEGKLVDRKACDEMIGLLRAQHDRAMIPRSLPIDEDGLQVANKTGEDLEKQPDARGVHRYVRVDAAIVEGERARYVLAIFARQGEDTRSSVDNEALVTGGALSRMIYDHFRRR
jgi:beta-lactamase class A